MGSRRSLIQRSLRRTTVGSARRRQSQSPVKTRHPRRRKMPPRSMYHLQGRRKRLGEVQTKRSSAKARTAGGRMMLLPRGQLLPAALVASTSPRTCAKKLKRSRNKRRSSSLEKRRNKKNARQERPQRGRPEKQRS